MPSAQNKAFEIKQWLEDYLVESALEPHDKLPPERELCQRWNLNRVTLNKAIRHLVNEGVLYSIKGSGTYVSERRIERNLWEFSSFTQAMQKSGSTVKTSVISIRLIEATKVIAGHLNLLLGNMVYKIERLRIVDNAPLALEVVYLPVDLCEGIEKFDLEANSLYELLDQHFDIDLVRSNQNIELKKIDQGIAKWLEIEKETAVLVLSGTAYDRSDIPIEYAESYTRGDRCVFLSHLRWSSLK